MVPRYSAACPGSARVARARSPCMTTHDLRCGSSVLRSCSLAVTPILPRRISFFPAPAFDSTALPSSSVVPLILGCGALSWFSNLHCLCTESASEFLATEPLREHDSAGDDKWCPVLVGVAFLSLLVGCCSACFALLCDASESAFVRFARPGPVPNFRGTASAGAVGYEEADLISSFHRVYQCEIFSVLLLPSAQALAIPVAPVGSLEDQVARGTVRLSDPLEWTAASDDVGSVVFFELPEDRWNGSHQRACFLGRHARFSPRWETAVWAQLLEGGRFGTVDDACHLSSPVRLPEEALALASEHGLRPFCTPETRRKAAAASPRRGRGAGAKAGRSAPQFQASRAPSEWRRWSKPRQLDSWSHSLDFAASDPAWARASNISASRHAGPSLGFGARLRRGQHTIERAN